MVDIFVGDVGDSTPTNTSDVFDVGRVDLVIFGDRADNTSIVYDVQSVDFVISPNRVDNTSDVYAVERVDFQLLANRINNTSIAYSPPLVDILTLTLSPATVTNTSIVYNGDQNIQMLSGRADNNIDIFSTLVTQDAICKPELVVNNSTIYPSVISFVDIPIVGTLVERNRNESIRTNKFVFSDFALDFVPHPITGDVAILYDVAAINQSLHNILLTKKFERPFDNYNVSSQIRSLLFSLSDNMLAVELKSEIFQVIVNYEPRINIVDIIVEATPQKHELYVKLFYRIKTFENVEVFKTIIS